MTIRRALLAFAVPALLGLAPSATLASATDPRVTTLIQESGAALHVSAMASVHVLHLTGKTEAVGLSGTGESWNEMGGVRASSIFSTPPLGGGSVSIRPASLPLTPATSGARTRSVKRF